MHEAITRAGGEKPAIHVSASDYDLIANYALSLETRAPALSRMLLDEIDRATVCAPAELPPGVIALGSEVSYRDESTGAVRRVQLVMPAEADIERGLVSILTPMGAGLVGLQAGQSIDWPCPDGRPRVLTILDVIQAP